MKVFISWSGERSRAVATALRDWLGLSLHFIEPWMSQQDIAAGERWAVEVAKELEASHFGVVCLTRENINAAWVMFEAGALSKAMGQGAVVPYLLDVDFSDLLRSPLSLFQGKKAEKSMTFDLVQSINGRSKTPIEEQRLRKLFDLSWPDLEEKLKVIPGSQPTQHVPLRPQHEVLEELVSVVRSIENRLSVVEQFAAERHLRDWRTPERRLLEDQMNARHVDVRLGRIVRTLRERQGIDIGELSNRTGLDAGVLNQIELGSHRPNSLQLEVMAKALNVVPETIMDGALTGSITVPRPKRRSDKD